MATLTEQLNQIKNSIGEAERELISLNSGRKVSASRVRKQLQSIKNQSQSLRKSVILYNYSQTPNPNLLPNPNYIKHRRKELRKQRKYNH